MGFKSNKYMTGMKSKRVLKTLSVATLVGVASLGATNSVQAQDTTTISVPNGETLELQTTYGEGNTSVTTNYTVLGQEVPYTYRFDNLYGDENGDTSIISEATVLGQPVTFTYKYQDQSNKTYTTKYENYSKDYGTITNPSGSTYSSRYLIPGGVYSNVEGTTTSIENTLFKNNLVTGTTESTSSSAKYVTVEGGAVYNAGEISKLTANFVGNSLEGKATTTSGYISIYANGGAIYNDGTIGNITGDFIGNYVDSISTSTVSSYYSCSADSYGGAISNKTDSSSLEVSIGDITGDFIGNYVNSSTSTSSSSQSYSYGGAISNRDFYAPSSTITIGDITGNFIGNYASSTLSDASGGAIYNDNYYTTSTIIIGDITGDFIGNHADSSGGAIYNSYNATIGDTTGNFIGNYSSYGGAIYNLGGKITSITGDFIGNYAKNDGGAIYNEKGEIGDITGDFIGNYIFDSSSYEGGGAIYNYTNGAYSTGIIGNITGDFIGNYVNSNSYYSVHGGAIYSKGNVRIGNITGDFIGNYASSASSGAYGGAISNGGKIGYITGNFIGNYADTNGGAIYNVGTIGNITGDFIGNYTSSSGGAIYNNPNGAIIGDITGNFIGNYADTNGGAIFNSASYNSVTIGNITGDFIGNYTSSNSYTASGGVIYNNASSSEVSTIGNITGNYIDNYASGTTARGGAIYNNAYGTSIIGNITGDFIGNYASSTSSSASGGAIYNKANSSSAEAIIGDITGDFIGNYAKSESDVAQGGAIYNTEAVSIVNSSFINNYASGMTAQGGAIYNAGTLSFVAKDGYTSVFSGNYTESAGAKDDNAILLDGSDAILNFKLEAGGKFLLEDNVSTTGHAVEEFYIDNGVSTFEEYAKSQGYKDTATDTFLSNVGYSTVDEYARSQGYKDTATDTFLSNVGYSTVDEYARSQGFKDTPTETFLASTGYSTLDEALRAKGFGDTPTETYLNMTGYTSLDVMVQDAGYESVDAFLAEIGYETFDEALKAEMNLYGDTPEEQFLNMSGCATFEEYLKNEQNLYGDTPEEQFVNNKGYESFEAYLKAKEKLSGDTPEEQFVYKEGYESFEAYLKSKEKLSGNTPEEQFLYKEGYKTFEDYLKANGYTGLPTVNIQGDDINNTTFYLYNDIRRAYVNIGNTTINTINNQVHNYDFWSLTLTDDTNMVVDVDLKNKTMDRFTANSYGEHQGNLNVTGMNLLSDAVSDKTEILFAEQGLKDNVVNGITSQLPDDKYQTTLFTPIYKYNVSYENRDDAGYFVFAGGPSSANKGSSEVFNPAVLGSSTSATVGATATINQTFNYAFSNADTTMNIPYLERVSMRDRNKYALSITGDATDMGRFSPLYQPSDEGASVWVKPYATFETVGLKNGPKVHNNTYGTLIGFDTEMQSIKRGWDRVFTGYIGYNGASQRYSGIDSTQNGGLLGGTMTLYKGNFFNATTVSVGASVANNQTMYGNEDFVMLLSGIGNKTGYNFEFKEGKLILQPSMLMSYTFVNTFDYTNAAGVRIDNKPLHALQLAPGVKVIGNLKGGWQPYASVQMVWNLMGESNATANGVKLPEMSIKPYVQYGVGVQKRIKDHFTAYGQAMVQNGGRNGVSLTAGFRWALGHDNCKYKVEDKQLRGNADKQLRGNADKQLRGNAAKQLRGNAAKQLRGNAAKQLRDNAAKSKCHYEERSDVVISSNNAIATPSARNDNGRKILKQMTPQQKMAHGGKYYNTTRTAKSGSLRQY